MKVFMVCMRNYTNIKQVQKYTNANLYKYKTNTGNYIYTNIKQVQKYICELFFRLFG